MLYNAGLSICNIIMFLLSKYLFYYNSFIFCFAFFQVSLCLATMIAVVASQGFDYFGGFPGFAASPRDPRANRGSTSMFDLCTGLLFFFIADAPISFNVFLFLILF